MNLARSTRQFLKNIRNEGWEILFENVKSFCEPHDISIPDMNVAYIGVLTSLQK